MSGAKVVLAALMAVGLSTAAFAADEQKQPAGAGKGAAVGAAAGHEVGSGHAVAGAATGAAIGHHERNKAESESTSSTSEKK